MKILEKSSYALSGMLFYIIDSFVEKGKITRKQVPAFVDFKIEGFDDILKLEVKSWSRYVAQRKDQKPDEFVQWEKSQFARYDSEKIMEELKSKVVEINTHLPKNVMKVFKADEGKSCWNEFASKLSSPDVYMLGAIEKTTMYFPASIFNALKQYVKMSPEHNTIRDVVVTAIVNYM